MDQDGFKAWTKFCAVYDNNGSENLQLEELEIELNTEFHTSYPSGLTSFIDNFQPKVAEAEVLAPDEYLGKRKQCLLFKILDSIEPIQHLVQTCRDHQEWTFNQMATYLRKNVVKLDNKLSNKPKRAMVLAEDSPPSPTLPTITIQQAITLFEEVAEGMGAVCAFAAFHSPIMQEKLSIPDSIWAALEPSIWEKIVEIRKDIRAKREATTSANASKPISSTSGDPPGTIPQHVTF